MHSKDFFKVINSIVDIDLPSESSHIKMASLERVQLMKDSIAIIENARKAAVMMLFYPKNGIIHLVLIVRNSYPGVHSSQIAFQGGKAENNDLNFIETCPVLYPLI
jgi:hypothetical protein